MPQPIEDLPLELIGIVLQFTNQHDVFQLAHTCKHFHDGIIHSNVVWYYRREPLEVHFSNCSTPHQEQQLYHFLNHNQITHVKVYLGRHIDSLTDLLRNVTCLKHFHLISKTQIVSRSMNSKSKGCEDNIKSIREFIIQDTHSNYMVLMFVVWILENNTSLDRFSLTQTSQVGHIMSLLRTQTNLKELYLSFALPNLLYLPTGITSITLKAPFNDLSKMLSSKHMLSDEVNWKKMSLTNSNTNKDSDTHVPHFQRVHRVEHLCLDNFGLNYLNFFHPTCLQHLELTLKKSGTHLANLPVLPNIITLKISLATVADCAKLVRGCEVGLKELSLFDITKDPIPNDTFRFTKLSKIHLQNVDSRFVRDIVSSLNGFVRVLDVRPRDIISGLNIGKVERIQTLVTDVHILLQIPSAILSHTNFVTLVNGHNNQVDEYAIAALSKLTKLVQLQVEFQSECSSSIVPVLLDSIKELEVLELTSLKLTQNASWVMPNSAQCLNKLCLDICSFTNDQLSSLIRGTPALTELHLSEQIPFQVFNDLVIHLNNSNKKIKKLTVSLIVPNPPYKYKLAMLKTQLTTLDIGLLCTAPLQIKTCVLAALCFNQQTSRNINMKLSTGEALLPMDHTKFDKMYKQVQLLTKTNKYFSSEVDLKSIRELYADAFSKRLSHLEDCSAIMGALYKSL